MAAWTDDELRRIGDADELEITAVRRDGTRRAPRPIWVVRAGDELYVRAALRAWERLASRRADERTRPDISRGRGEGRDGRRR